MEDEASMTVGPVTAALSQMTRMSSARSGTLGPSSRPLSTRSHASRHGDSPPPLPHKTLAVVVPLMRHCCSWMLHILWVPDRTPACTVFHTFVSHQIQATHWCLC